MKTKKTGWIGVNREGWVCMGSTRKSMHTTGCGKHTPNGFEYPLNHEVLVAINAAIKVDPQATMWLVRV
jgi:hypothetical protein